MSLYDGYQRDRKLKEQYEDEIRELEGDNSALIFQLNEETDKLWTALEKIEELEKELAAAKKILNYTFPFSSWEYLKSYYKEITPGKVNKEVNKE